MSNLCKFIARTSGIQTCVATRIEGGFMEFCRRLVTSLSTLIAACFHGIRDSITEAKCPLRTIIANHEVEMSLVSPNIASNGGVKRYSNFLVSFYVFVIWRGSTATASSRFGLALPMTIDKMIWDMVWWITCILFRGLSIPLDLV